MLLINLGAMQKSISVERISAVRERVAELVRAAGTRLRGARYIDLRLEVEEGKGASSENGMEKSAAQGESVAFGVRVIAEAAGGPAAPGYFGRVIGADDWKNLKRVLQEGIRHAYERALANSRWKGRTKGILGEAISACRLAPIEIRRETIGAMFVVDPRGISLKAMSQTIAGISRRVRASRSEISYCAVSGSTTLRRRLFVSSEGGDIDQSFAITQGSCYVVASGSSGSSELYDSIGHQRGWEIIESGASDGPLSFPDLASFSEGLARDAADLSNAPPLPAGEGEVVVVTDPHFNALLAHEIIGHPCELDRALKRETAYAGRSWLLSNLKKSQVGERIASDLVTAFSDPSLPGFGHYAYDHEGTLAKRVIHIDRGIFKGFMNSRQTAAVLSGAGFDAEPNGSYVANSSALVPLIRMSNTCFAAGESDPSKIISEVDKGYYLVRHRIPSIAESRENFRITAMKVYEIRKGEIGRLFRDGGITADSRDFLMAIDAVGKDFRLFPIPNCGKGVPMQSKRLGNGGPTLRSRARLTGGPAG